MQDETGFRFATFLTDQLGFAAIEDALSGRGLENCDRFIRSQRGILGNRSSADTLHALQQGEPHARDCFLLFSRVLAQVIGDLALTHLPLGGIVLAGGLARASAPFLKQAGFVEDFYDKGRFSTYLQRFPVSVLDNDFAALIGASRLLTQR